VRPKLGIGGRGQLDVFVDGRLVFSRKQAGRYPTPEEIADELDRK
jgi:selT/selW/selH-like putative selenoprotein